MNEIKMNILFLINTHMKLHSRLDEGQFSQLPTDMLNDVPSWKTFTVSTFFTDVFIFHLLVWSFEMCYFLAWKWKILSKVISIKLFSAIGT